ncbi:sulfotransferase 1 family member D1-like [Haematobia irritans]|uniref:sulfotransferase 1 family member D1-like n=1 Tax=Haematobia irritans TaxID=7368 RepID=UPI003F4F6CF7
MFNTRQFTREISKDRMILPLKEYSASGQNIPLKKNWHDSWCTLPKGFDNVIPEILNYPVKKDDVYIVTYIKSGTTWMQETAWLLLNNLDLEKCRNLPQMERSPFLDFHGILPSAPNGIELSKTLPSPRLLKTHMPANLLPLQIWECKPKLIYVARNCKDVIVSSYHFVKNLGLWRCDNIGDYITDFMNNEVLYTCYWSHIVDFWKMRNESFIFFTTYEEMKQNLAGVIQKLCNFLDRSELKPNEMETILKHLTFDSMKENEKTNLTGILKANVPGAKNEFEFMRRGIVGSYMDELRPELCERIDKWSQEYLAQHGLTEKDIFGEF